MAGEIEITVVGNLVADPELRFTSSGVACTNFTVAATSKRFSKESGQFEDGDSVFLKCTAWRGLAENIAESLHRGQHVIVQGHVVQRSFETKQGEKRSVVEVQVMEVGASLRWGTAVVTKKGSSPSSAGFTSQGSAPAAQSWGGVVDAPPF